jgi:ribosomal protein S18 acetylase RimI-like enzyme
MSRYELRAAKKKDLEFLFEVSTIAMLPVRRVNKPSFQPNLEEEFKEYAKKFIPEKIKVIQFKKTDVGRLRVVRTSDEIYIGGIQILPKYQNKGIGSAILEDLVKESEKLKLPIKLEVAKVNKRGRKFYESFGFVTVGERGTDWIMKYEAN